MSRKVLVKGHRQRRDLGHAAGHMIPVDCSGTLLRGWYSAATLRGRGTRMTDQLGSATTSGRTTRTVRPPTGPAGGAAYPTKWTVPTSFPTSLGAVIFRRPVRGRYAGKNAVDLLKGSGRSGTPSRLNRRADFVVADRALVEVSRRAQRMIGPRSCFAMGPVT